MPETIDLLLKELKLPTFSRHYQRHQAQAIDKGYGHIRYLSGLCEQEVADRYQKPMQKWTHGFFYGIMRTAQLQKIVITNTMGGGGDWHLIVNIISIGKSRMSPLVAVHRELGGATTS